MIRQQRNWFVLFVMVIFTGNSCLLAGEKHEEHGGEGEESATVKLTPAQVKLAEIKERSVLRGNLQVEIALMGEVALNQDRLAHITPRVSGIVKKVVKTLGNKVRAGEVMAILESSDLGEAEAAYQAEIKREALAKTKYEREKHLWEKKVSAEQEYLEAKQVYAESRIQLRATKQKLLSIGVSAEHLARLAGHLEEPHLRYEITAPFTGTIIEKHITRGELVDVGARLYTLCDLSSVWVMAKVYEKDIARVKRGQSATFQVAAYRGKSFSGKITWLAATLDEETRTLAIRIQADNSDGQLKPRMFARVVVGVATREGVLEVPAAAIQRQKGETIVLVAKGDGEYERREVKVGIRSAATVEVLTGLREGEKVVTSGSFLLKSELEKEGFDD